MTNRPPPLPQLPNIQETAIRLWNQIPAGRVATYGSLAKALGSSTASRWVGSFAKSHKHLAQCGCHRLVRADGSLGSYATGEIDEKATLLHADGITFTNGKVNVSEFRFDGFQGKAPLDRLAEYQNQIASLVDLSNWAASASTEIGGVDVSYSTPEKAVAAYAIVDAQGALIWSHTIQRKTNFPYISGFLAFRELPILIDLIEEVRAARTIPAVTMVDGSGVLHPRSSGVASMLGVATNTCTVGVTKKILCGSLASQPQPDNKMVPIFVDDILRGGAMLPTTGSQKPLYFSPGHLIDVVTTLKISRQQCSHFRLPMPIYWADKISRKVANQA